MRNLFSRTSAVLGVLFLAAAALMAEDAGKCEDSYNACLTRIAEAGGVQIQFEEPAAAVLSSYKVKAALTGKPEKMLKKACGDVCKVEVKDGRATIALRDKTRTEPSGVLTFLCKDTVTTSFGGSQGSTRYEYVTNPSPVPCALRNAPSQVMQADRLPSSN
jgi:hypothetical protein